MLDIGLMFAERCHVEGWALKFSEWYLPESQDP